MNNTARIAMIVALAGAVVLVLATKPRPTPPAPSGPAHAVTSPPASPPGTALPRLLELGSVTCIPCRMMAPILEELRRECAGKLRVDFIDTQKDPTAAQRYGIRLIPTQIFFDASGEELFRHEGFFPKADILAKWKELGYAVAPP